MRNYLKAVTAKIHLLLTSIFSVFCVIMQAQSAFHGIILNVAKRPLPFTSIVLSTHNKTIAGATTDESGKFTIAFIADSSRLYTMTISLLGYQSFTRSVSLNDSSSNLKITLTEDKKLLGSVTVYSNRKLITRRADRYIVNVENSFLADGNTALEVLSKSPGVWVDSKGSIRIKGNQAVTVMINDVVQRMSEDDLAEYLRTLKSEDVSKIEIIQNPGSEFQAAGTGGIVHIILKKAKKNGLTGSANVQYRQQGPKPYISGGTSLDYKFKKLYFAAGYTYVRDDRSYYETSKINYANADLYDSYTDRKEKATRRLIKYAVIYDVSKDHSVGLQINANKYDFIQLYDNSLTYKKVNQIVTGTGNTTRARTLKFQNATFNYNWKIDTIGATFKIIADFSENRKTENSTYNNLYSDSNINSFYRVATPNTVDIYSIQVGYTKPFNSKHEFKSGVEYVAIKRNNSNLREDKVNAGWITNTFASSNITYSEELLMFYSSIEKSINKINIKAGLRAEQTWSAGKLLNTGQQFRRQYFGLFPSIFITRTIDETHGTAIYINYSRRLQRPALSELNPYRIEYSNNTSVTGNPKLLPQFSHNVELGYNFIKNFSANVYVTSTKDIIALFANVGSNNFIEYTTENVNSSLEYGLSVYAPFEICKGWWVNNNVTYNGLFYKTAGANIKQTNVSARTVHTIKLKKIADFEATADYRSGYRYSNISTAYTFYFDAGLSRKIAKNSARIKLYVADIFNSLREKEVTYINGSSINFFRKRPTRTAALSCTWNFSAGKKFSGKKIDQGNTEGKTRSN